MRAASQSSPQSTAGRLTSRVRRSIASATTTAILAVSVALPGTAMADYNTVMEVIGTVSASTVDLFVIRPLSIVRLGVGAGVLLPMSSLMNFMALPIGQDTKVFTEDWDRLVVEPKEYAFDRAIGEDLVGG